jgi:thiamine biosynthesis protein ThiS
MSEASEMLEITVNGEPRAFTAPLSLGDLLDRLKIDGRQVAVERNRSIVPKTRFAETLLEAGDCLEVVTLVGGG